MVAHAQPVSSFLGQLPPHDKRAETALLGGILRDPDVLPDVREIVALGNFYFDAHQKVFGAICDLASRNVPIDLVGVHALLRDRRQLEDVGGAEFIADLWSEAGTGANATYHARLIREAALLRGIIHAANEVLRDAYDRTQPAEELLASTERSLADLADKLVPTGGDVRCASEFLPAALQRIDDRISSGGSLGGLATGYRTLDDLLGGLRPGQLVVVGARPSHGKTALGLNLCANAAGAGTPVLFFSLEMPEAEIADRLLAMGSGVCLHKVRRGGGLTETEAERLARAASPAGLGGCGLYLDDQPDQPAARLLAVTRRAVRKHGVGLVVIDYLQLMRPDNPRDNRNQQVGQSARAIKMLARQCEVPVILMSQLNREVEGRNGGKPRLADLRESGEIEQHADAVLLLHPHPENQQESEVWMKDVIVAKNRNGPIGDVTLAYRRPVMRFEVPKIGGF